MGHIKNPKILFGKVMHARLFPRKNSFVYGIYYMAVSLSALEALPIKRNKFAALSFYDSDHGPCDGSNIESWARGILSDYKITKADGDITLICMPRVFGYVFNPVSFYLCRDKDGDLRAVICEVNNTFGERHCYICAYQDQSPIKPGDVLKGEKVFHVSPFLKREGHYEFQFDCGDDHADIKIDFFDGQGQKQLVTSLKGDDVPMDQSALRRAFWGYPLITFKAILLIHWQALKLVMKGIKYIPKPQQKTERSSAAITTITKN